MFSLGEHFFCLHSQIEYLAFKQQKSIWSLFLDPSGLRPSAITGSKGVSLAITWQDCNHTLKSALQPQLTQFETRELFFYKQRKLQRLIKTTRNQHMCVFYLAMETSVPTWQVVWSQDWIWSLSKPKRCTWTCLVAVHFESKAVKLLNSDWGRTKARKSR